MRGQRAARLCRIVFAAGDGIDHAERGAGHLARLHAGDQRHIDRPVEANLPQHRLHHLAGAGGEAGNLSASLRQILAVADHPQVSPWLS
jgi:hypothetical protein